MITVAGGVSSIRTLFVAGFVWAMFMASYSFGTSPKVLGPRLVDIAAANEALLVAYSGEQGESWIDSYDAQTGSLRWRRHFPHTALVGRLGISDGLLCAPAFVGGIYILDLGNGAEKAHLRTGKDGPQPKVGCTPSCILVTNGRSGWDEELVAFDTGSFRPIWRRTLPHSYMWQVASAGNRFELLVSEPFGPGPSHPPRRYEKVVVSAEDGLVLCRKLAARPGEHDIIPGTLPVAMRKWLTQLLRRKGGIFLPRTRIERLGALWLVGNLEDRTAPSRVFAIRSKAAEVVWQRDVPGLADIILHNDRLIVAAVGSPQARTDRMNRTKGRLMALDAQTGRLLWTSELTDSL